jgi:hypothetical protein
MASAPLILDPQILKRLPGANPLASLPAPTLPNVTKTPDPTALRLLGDQNALSVLRKSGSGVDQITRPVDENGDPTGQHVGALRQVGGVLGRIGDVAASLALGKGAGILPGTTQHNFTLQNQAQGRINNDLANQQSQAQTTLLDAQPQLKQMGLENTFLKNQGYLQHVQDQGQHYDNQDANHLRDTGYALDEADPSGQKIRPLRYEEMSEKQQVVEDLKHAQTEQAEATAAMKKAQNDTSAPAFKLAKQRADIAQQNANTALGRLGLQGQSLDLRRQNTNASLYGTDNAGTALPGSAQITGDNGEQTTVGSKFANTAIKANTKTVTFNDLTGSVSHLRNAVKAYEAEGGDMSDPRLAAAASDPHSTVGKVIQGKLVTGGLSPSAITLLNAQRQTEEQAGILRSTTGGTSSEAGAQRILAVVPHFGSDTNHSAYSKLDEQEGVLKRLAPGQTHVQGGVSVSRPGGSGETIPAAASAQLEEGKNHTFNNGQVWTKVGGVPKRVK